jgi:antitoxin (DNA-binding transcriptional repressor) of toxin-antitoxin stability system
LSSLASALSLPSNLMRFTRLIDGAWALCVKRADDAGMQLARSLLLSTAGHRPVTLIGYGMGARMIYSCLKELAYHQEKWENEREQEDPNKKRRKSAARAPRLGIQLARFGFMGRQRRRTTHDADAGLSLDAENKVALTRDVSDSGDDELCKENLDTKERAEEEYPSIGEDEFPTLEHAVLGQEKEVESPSVSYTREPASIIEDAILMGCPAYIHRPSWEACRRMVGGRLVNCYNPSDLILALMFQYECMSGLFRPTCGTYAVKVPGVENYNVSKLITAHSEYSVAVGEILQLIQHGEPVAKPSPVEQKEASTVAEEESQSDGEASSGEEVNIPAKLSHESPKGFCNLFEMSFASRSLDQKETIKTSDEAGTEICEKERDCDEDPSPDDIPPIEKVESTKQLMSTRVTDLENDMFDNKDSIHEDEENKLLQID